MNKPESLRAHLLAAIPELRHNPDRMAVFIDNGSIRSTAATGLSFEYSYTLNIILLEFAGSPDAVAIPLLAWVLVNQRELMENLNTGRDAIKFEADVIDNSKVDLSITLPLTERVIVKAGANGALVVTHPAEPEVDDQLITLSSLRIENSAGELLAEWGQA
ncbi:phage tail protein [Pseudomonas kuykendallii]|uniref:P2 phage tail completion protein R (GpR) n=1 Tax=Pseudomonas kuykendallii TaxID=1007099 RepID=A0A1H3DL26_9PSED|nr:phage tail protein [Pseudomonas kuykendallii]MCQ4270263.1 phage tail protein [Pseudomonas kuykendallii]SDX66344.1 P2 phage tail completion protein R (GpR) [Pseudomonas kuykendallii]